MGFYRTKGKRGRKEQSVYGITLRDITLMASGYFLGLSKVTKDNPDTAGLGSLPGRPSTHSRRSWSLVLGLTSGVERTALPGLIHQHFNQSTFWVKLNQPGVAGGHGHLIIAGRWWQYGTWLMIPAALPVKRICCLKLQSPSGEKGKGSLRLIVIDGSNVACCHKDWLTDWAFYLD